MNSYLIISVKGRNISNFLHKCKKNNIDILKINNISHKQIIIKINETDYEKLVKIKSYYKIEVINSNGLIKYKELIKNNKILIICLVIGFLFLVFLSNIIFEVKIISNDNDLNKKVAKELKNYNIEKYKLKKNYNEIQEIKDKLLKKFKNTIEWIEITDIGTKYEVKIVQRKKNNKIKEIKYSNIVAKKSGVIKSIYAQSGQKIVDLNTYVNKGDVIISGIIMKGEEEKDYVRAKGKVFAEVWYTANIEFPLKYTEKKYTNNNAKRLYIKLNNKYITNNKFKEYERKTYKNLKSNIVPFEFGIELQREVKIINDTYSIKEAKKKAIEKAKEKILQILDKDEYIIDENILNFSEKNSKIELNMFFSCYIQIGKEEEFNKDDIINQKKE